jgi:predicted dienelactone hydrolase
VVVGVDHSDSSMVVYPDGTYLHTDLSDVLGREQNAQLLQDRIRDFDVLLDVLSYWNENDSLFAGRLAVEKVAVAGFSFGGVAAGEFCRLDPRCVAAVALDPGGFEAAPALSTLGLQKPSLTMHNPAWPDDFLYSKATTNAYWFQIRNTEHWSFGTWYWTVTSTSLPNRREGARTVADWTLWFLNKYLKGSSDPMPQTADYPQIFNFKKK